MNFQKGANRLLVVLVVIWEALWLLPLSVDHGRRVIVMERLVLQEARS